MKTLLLLLALAVPLCAQALPYGEISDLKGLKKVYVNTGLDMKSHRAIVKALEKSNLGFEIVEDVEDSEIMLVFGAGSVEHGVVATNTNGVATAQVVESPTGDGYVTAYARDKVRLVLSFKDTQGTVFERKPVSNFVRTFLKAYKQANGVKRAGV